MKFMHSAASLYLLLGLLLATQGCHLGAMSQFSNLVQFWSQKVTPPPPDQPDQNDDQLFRNDFLDPVQAWMEGSTHYQIAQGSTQALSKDFPDYLELPGATVIASGQIRDAAGEINTLVLRTEQSAASVLKYYREKLWYQQWDIVSEEIHQDSAMITFNYSITDDYSMTEDVQQIVLQIATPLSQPHVRDVIVMLSKTRPDLVLAKSIESLYTLNEGEVLLTLKSHSFTKNL
jgi:hypothetical protein